MTAEGSKRYDEILELAKEMGLDFYDIHFEIVPFEIMTEIASYGLPVRAHHWSYGKVYNHQKLYGEMGLSKIYEIVLNNDPSYAFLLDSNSEVENMLVVAHVAAHVDFFKNNVYFSPTDRNMVNRAMDHAIRVDQYKESYGLEKVEKIMDIGFALDQHIDPFKGERRERYPGRKIVEKVHNRGDYEDLTGEDKKFSVKREIVGGKLPPQPEKDLLFFLMNYAPLEDWERDVLAMIRAESYYFFPQFETKIINEGWASYWHAEVINNYSGITPTEMIDFARIHSGVVQPGHPMQINPYYLGYRILRDIRARWDKLYQAGESDIDGKTKMFRVREEDNDISLLQNYLTKELAQELKLFVYGPKERQQNTRGEIIITSRDLEIIKERLVMSKYNYGAPKVVIQDIEAGALCLEQLNRQYGGLERKYAEQTLNYIHQLWHNPVQILTCDDEGDELILRYDGEFKVIPGRKKSDETRVG